jgi:hypothetical protein
MLLEINPLTAYTDVISWCSDGTSFVIKQPREFTDSLLPRYFRTNKFSSFQRQLNAYGFVRSNLYSDQDGIHIYHHRLFHRDHPDRLPSITRRNSLTKKGTVTTNKKTWQMTKQRQQLHMPSGLCGPPFSDYASPQFEISFPLDTPLPVTVSSRDALFFDGGANQSVFDATVVSDEDSISFPRSDDLLRVWNPEMESLSSESDDEYLL